MENITIRPARLEDASEILKIYEPYIKKTTITFEYEVPSLEEFRGRMTGIIGAYPYLVCEADGKILAYAYAHRFMKEPHISGMRSCPFMLRKNIRDWGWERRCTMH